MLLLRVQEEAEEGIMPGGGLAWLARVQACGET